VVDGGEPGVDSRDEGKHTGMNDLLFVKEDDVSHGGAQWCHRANG